MQETTMFATTVVTMVMIMLVMTTMTMLRLVYKCLLT
jgi:hypothetical protein